MATVIDTDTEQRPAADRPWRARIPQAWRLLGSLVAVGALVFGTYQVVVALAHEEHTVRREFDAAGITTIEVGNGADGAIRVTGSDTDTIVVTARISDGLRETGHSQRVEGDRLVLDSSCPLFGSSFCQVTYTIETPPDVDLRLRSSNSGITVSDIRGDVDARSDNGGVELARIRGAVTAHSDNGGVTARELDAAVVDAGSDNGSVRLDFDEAPETVTAESDNGDVEVVLAPGDQTYRVDTHTDNGTVSTQVRTDPASSRSIVASSDNGDVTLRYRTG